MSSSGVANGICSCETSRFPKASSTGKLTISINPPTTPSRTPSVSDTRSTAPRCLPTQGDYFPFPRLSVYFGYSLLRGDRNTSYKAQSSSALSGHLLQRRTEILHPVQQVVHPSPPKEDYKKREI